MGSAYGFGPGYPGLIPCLCITMGFLPLRIHIVTLNKRGPPIERLILDDPETVQWRHLYKAR